MYFKLFLITGLELENVLESITNMSLDFILTEDILYTKESDVRVPGVILWCLVPDVEVYERRYKTIFSDVSKARERILHYYFRNSKESNSGTIFYNKTNK